MVISESKKRVMISLTKEQDKKLTDMAKTLAIRWRLKNPLNP